MSKVATYLRGHISGEVSARSDVCQAVSTDGGVLSIKPELVIYPRTTNDVRKVTRFAWQLAEKGHVMPITVRGAGTDPTGAAIGKGISLVTMAHMNQLFEYDAKQKLLRLQPGATVHGVSQALSLHGTALMPLFGSIGIGTIGGAVASGVAGPLSGKYGTIDKAIDQLEVVLANGDVIQTGRISKRELNRRKGLQGMEGDIYRGIDGLIEENGELLDSLRADDATGYNAIADVKQKDGSFDLTPLFVGSQGTLGIITEMIMRAEFRSLHFGVAALVYQSANDARDALDALCKLQPAFIEYFDAALFDAAADRGHVFQFYAEAVAKTPGESVILLGFDDFNERHREKQLKKAVKLVAKANVAVTTANGDAAGDLMAALDVAYYTSFPDTVETASPGLYGGFHIPGERFEEFCGHLSELADKLHTALPLAGHAYTGTYTVYPSLSLHKVSDKQLIFKLLDELTSLVTSCGGTMISEGGEGRLKGKFVYAQLDETQVKLYQDIKSVFDPHGILGPGVKAANDVKHLAELLRDHHDVGQLGRFGI